MISTTILKNIFLPKKIKSFYLFTQRIVAFELTDHSLFATIIRAHREKRTIQKFLEQPYDAQDPHGLENALKILLQEIGSYDAVYIALPASLAVFKTITLPFINPEKIKLILPFEVESLLPFSLQDAVIDAIINPTMATHSSEVFVAAVKRSTLDTTLQPFFDAGIQPQRVTLGAIEIYGLIKTSSLSLQGLSCCIDFSSEQTTIMLFVHGILSAIRVLPEGISQDVLRIDFTASHTQLPASIKIFFGTIQFTVQAMIKTINAEFAPTKHPSLVIITGIGAQCAGIDMSISNLLKSPCIVFQPHKLLHDGLITMEHKNSISPEYLISLATALSSPTTENFNIGSIYTEKQTEQLFKYQVLTAVGLLIFMVISFSSFSFLTMRKLRNEADILKEEIRKKLVAELNLENISKKDSLDTVITQAQQKLTREKSIWSALSQSQRHSFLYYLQELETHVDVQELGLDMKRLAIKSDENTGKDTIRLEGRVRDFNEAIKLTEDLQKTNLFYGTDIPPQQDPIFDISLTVNKNNEVNQ